jgi:hypothetical protein
LKGPAGPTLATEHLARSRANSDYAPGRAAAAPCVPPEAEHRLSMFELELDSELDVSKVELGRNGSGHP